MNVETQHTGGPGLGLGFGPHLSGPLTHELGALRNEWWCILAIGILLVVFGVGLKWFPASGGYGFDLIPNLSWKFVWSVIVHYQLPFWSIV